ncbi:MAG: hypothetical protein LBG17_04325 [Bacteroidales bacterium]|jgi:hypothetical protein|nr:hypothetical protein [Bacteroidales bacterium]
MLKRGKRLRDLSEESAITNSKPFFIQTNPISNNEQQQYKINRAITQLRATNLANGDVLGAYLFMSDDGFALYAHLLNGYLI